jgi:ferredoxin-NADP reductase
VTDPPTRFVLEVARVVQETPRDRTVVLRVPPEHRAAFRFVPGQFVVLRDPAWEERLQRPYSISSAPSDEGEIAVTVRDAGRFGDHLYSCEPGRRLEVMRPRGLFVLALPPGFDLVLAGGGAGVTPFRSFLRHLRHEGHRDRVVLLSSARVPEDLVFDAELRALEREAPWFRYLPTVTRPEGDAWSGHRGRVDEALLAEAVPRPTRTAFYACGPNEFVDAMERLATAHGIPKPMVHRERWG